MLVKDFHNVDLHNDPAGRRLQLRKNYAHITELHAKASSFACENLGAPPTFPSEAPILE
jgi:hypothetical protein